MWRAKSLILNSRGVLRPLIGEAEDTASALDVFGDWRASRIQDWPGFKRPEFTVHICVYIYIYVWSATSGGI